MSAITLVWPDRAEKPTMGKHASQCLTQKAPYKGLCADFGEKHAPASDPDAVTVDSLKALDPNRQIREATVIATGPAVATYKTAETQALAHRRRRQCFGMCCFQSRDCGGRPVRVLLRADPEDHPSTRICTSGASAGLTKRVAPPGSRTAP